MRPRIVNFPAGFQLEAQLFLESVNEGFEISSSALDSKGLAQNGRAFCLLHCVLYPDF